MGKYPQNRFHRLEIVGPNDKTLGRASVPSRRWGQQGSPEAGQRKQSKSVPMTARPTLSRGFLSDALVWIRNAVRAYFVSGSEQRRGAVVLSFRRHGAPAYGFRRVEAAEDLVNK